MRSSDSLNFNAKSTKQFKFAIFCLNQNLLLTVLLVYANAHEDAQKTANSIIEHLEFDSMLIRVQPITNNDIFMFNWVHALFVVCIWQIARSHQFVFFLCQTKYEKTLGKNVYFFFNCCYAMHVNIAAQLIMNIYHFYLRRKLFFPKLKQKKCRLAKKYSWHCIFACLLGEWIFVWYSFARLIVRKQNSKYSNELRNTIPNLIRWQLFSRYSSIVDFAVFFLFLF